MAEKKPVKKQPVVEAINEAMDIVAEVVADVPQYCDQCGTLVTHCICRWRGNEVYDCDCSMCPCMAQVKTEGAVCQSCKAHE